MLTTVKEYIGYHQGIILYSKELQNYIENESIDNELLLDHFKIIKSLVNRNIFQSSEIQVLLVDSKEIKKSLKKQVKKEHFIHIIPFLDIIKKVDISMSECTPIETYSYKESFHNYIINLNFF